MNLVVQGSVVLSETTLNVSNEVVGLQIPNKSIIYHTFHSLTEAARE